ncbi:MAG: excinuclease ABC subunit UvrC [Bacteroidaceae bacterium]|nr:excinuclease ABC subunit UvrC [Bacteroidaceae bacterium]
MAATTQHIKDILALLPDSPGVYQYFDKEGTIIYVGKAKNLKRRVSSYFNKQHDDAPKTRVLVRNIADLKYIVVGTEEDALHLENSLIKKYRPRYNVLLKDDKTYPWICVTKEEYPRVFLTRRVERGSGAKYYGPYAHVHIAKTMIELIHDLYPLRTCRLSLTPDALAGGRHKVCLQYHIKRCKGCCEGRISPQEYASYIEAVKHILNGNTGRLCDMLKTEMFDLAAQMRYEEAQVIKEKYDLVERYRAKSVVVSSVISHVDVFSYDEDDNAAFVNFMHVMGGSIVQSVTIEYRKKLDETAAEILALGIAELRARFQSTSREVIVPFEPEVTFEQLHITIPERGDKRKLLDISIQNVRQYKVDRLKQAEKLNPEQRAVRILSRLQKDLYMSELPIHIECFDNSNIQGTNAVAACVVFKMAKPSKKDYRHFNIKSVTGPDDYASMREIVYRRYHHLLEEGASLPQLIVVDGGKGQLSAAISSLEALGLRGKIAIIGIAERLEEIYFPEDSTPLYLDKNSESLRLIQHLRDEAHRFGITHHRNKRSKQQVVSALDGIKGIGRQTSDALLRHFKSVKRIREASLEELAALIGPAKARKVVEALSDSRA